MNREIKFRAWDKLIKKFYLDNEDLYVCHDKIFFKSRDKNNKYTLSISNAHCDYSQYTGLKDKNGVAVYEGDIVKWGHLENSRENEIRIATVKIDPDIQFDCRNIHYPHIFHFGTFAYGSDQMEVIGNIYEHPQLIAG